jgi:hypothetical protein
MLTMTNAPKITDVLGNPLICHLVNLELERDDFVIFGSARCWPMASVRASATWMS